MLPWFDARRVQASGPAKHSLPLLGTRDLAKVRLLTKPQPDSLGPLLHALAQQRHHRRDHAGPFAAKIMYSSAVRRANDRRPTVM
jgi:hypothetical protein